MSNLVIGVKIIREGSYIELEKALNAEIKNLNESYKVLDVTLNIQRDMYFIGMIKYGYILKQK